MMAQIRGPSKDHICIKYPQEEQTSRTSPKPSRKPDKYVGERHLYTKCRNRQTNITSAHPGINHNFQTPNKKKKSPESTFGSNRHDPCRLSTPHCKRKKKKKRKIRKKKNERSIKEPPTSLPYVEKKNIKLQTNRKPPIQWRRLLCS